MYDVNENIADISVVYLYDGAALWGDGFLSNSKSVPVEKDNVVDSEDTKITECLYRACSKETILAWGRQKEQYYCEMYEYHRGGNHVIVLLRDTGSGLSLKEIYVFSKTDEMKQWQLILYRPTYTDVKVQEVNDKLIFKSAADRTILDISFDDLVVFRWND